MAGFEIEFWYWWVVAVALLAVEMAAPGAAFLWMAIGAGVVGLLLLVAPGTAVEWQLLLFAVVAVASGYGWRAYRGKRGTVSDQPALNRRGEQLVGRVLTLEEAIENGVGMVKVDDSRWKVEGSDLPAGSRVRVTGVHGTVLKVEKAEA
ncbi:MAG: NfeD family protein [Kiloniellales bacterium]